MLRWYLVRTKGRGETLAKTNLERQGYEVFLPRLAQTIRRRGRWQDRVLALFPGYIFLRLNVGSQSLAPVRSTKGVTDVVRFGLSYAIVPDPLVRILQASADPLTGLHHQERPDLPKPGMVIEISTGPFDGLEGIYERRSGDERVVVLLDLLGRGTRVQVPLESVFPVPQHRYSHDLR